MAQRPYTVSEIERMRQALQIINTPIGISYSQTAIDARVEDQLRTYMVNGTEPDELGRRAAETKHRYFTREVD
jgi:hypothetical protein